jgi:hypothetical protein
MSRRGLQIALTLLGSVAFVFGALSVLFGVDLISGSYDPMPNVDSELRFFSAWYAAAGLILLRAAPRVGSQHNVILAILATFFVAGCARLLSLITVGTPDTRFVVLMVVEMALPVLILPWQAAVARRHRAHMEQASAGSR